MKQSDVPSKGRYGQAGRHGPRLCVEGCGQSESLGAVRSITFRYPCRPDPAAGDRTASKYATLLGLFDWAGQAYVWKKRASSPDGPTMEDLAMSTHVGTAALPTAPSTITPNCNAAAITVAGGSTDHASCATFIDTGLHGGLPKVLANIGAASARNASTMTT